MIVWVAVTSLLTLNVNALSEPGTGVSGPSPWIYLQTLICPTGVVVAVGVLVGCVTPLVWLGVGVLVAELVDVAVGVLLGGATEAVAVGVAVLVLVGVGVWQTEPPSFPPRKRQPYGVPCCSVPVVIAAPMKASACHKHGGSVAVSVAVMPGPSTKGAEGFWA